MSYFDQKPPSEFWPNLIAGMIVVFIIVAILGTRACMYGDWKCAFIQCRKVVP